MAGDWIKIESVMPDKPEVGVIAEELGIDHDAVIGKLVRFWIWADQQSVDGNALSVTFAFHSVIRKCPFFRGLTVMHCEVRYGKPVFFPHKPPTLFHC